MITQPTETISLYIGRHQVTLALGGVEETRHAACIIAGILAASRELLTPTEFDHLIAACGLDPLHVANLLELAVADPEQPHHL